MRYKKNRGVAPSSGKTQLSIIAQNQNRELGRGGGDDRGREGSLMGLSWFGGLEKGKSFEM